MIRLVMLCVRRKWLLLGFVLINLARDSGNLGLKICFFSHAVLLVEGLW